MANMFKNQVSRVFLNHPTEGQIMKPKYISPMVIAVLYAEAGDKDRAIKWLNKAYAAQEPQMASPTVNPHWDNLRSDPRFDELLSKVGLVNDR